MSTTSFANPYLKGLVSGIKTRIPAKIITIEVVLFKIRRRIAATIRGNQAISNPNLGVFTGLQRSENNKKQYIKDILFDRNLNDMLNLFR